ncbi:tRNA1(Val) (adenine(37)-N6)-methyltransferase [Dyadobacter sandarakinus]|uniref:tRNA1(Val) (adenine(37)-N6)-methyltransferase n=1 Tax=Dyadobacter sandarakinus TaxID=2747268 RepID=A0ABX7I6D0_9BACT|nr:methyltransferase [Dyadobacter sandarakinus]QRR01654.1 methyltransferase [Dyadobacter sandarakinus]
MAGNSYFRFKQFTIQQDQCAMKVCTDACAFGAWVHISDVKSILDIGTGTGLLALMAAQRNELAHIDTVEIEPNAFSQAGQNIADSPFADRIKLYHEDIRRFRPGYRYDAVITNPPFFQADLLSPDQEKNQAHHAHSLAFDELLTASDQLLADDGSFHVLLPVAEAGIFIKKAERCGWKQVRGTTLYHQPGKKPFRQFMTFKRTATEDLQPAFSNLFIYENDGKTYHPDFVSLLKMFYLKF